MNDVNGELVLQWIQHYAKIYEICAQIVGDQAVINGETNLTDR